MRVALALWMSLCSSIAWAGTYTVTKSGDSADGLCDADCSLREALAAADASPGADLVRLKLTGYALTLGELAIRDSVTVRGLASSRSTISAGKASRVLSIGPDAVVELDDLVIRDGFVNGQGGGIRNEGALTLRRVTVEANRVTGAAQGGGIWSNRSLRVLDSTIRLNVARDDATLAGGRGGGIHNARPGQVYLYDSAVRENACGEDDSTGYGGGLYNTGQARIDRGFFWRNDPGDGEGSAIANRDGGTLGVFNTTLSYNGHDGADGAIANGSWGEIALENQAARKPAATVYNSTIANNNGGGLLNTGKAVLRNAIVAGNYSQDGNDKYYGTGINCHNEEGGTLAQAYTLMGQGSRCDGAVFADDSRVFADWLGHLRYYGGPAPMHKPINAALVDQGDPDYCTAQDQREVARPVDGDGDGMARCDIGAMEVQPGE